MPRPSRPQRSQRSHHSNWNEVWGIASAAAGVFLFLALISYNPKDLPSWMFFASSARSSGQATNLIGSVGAVIAGLSYWFIGATSFLLAVAMVGFGGVKLISPTFRMLPRLGWAFLFLVSACCLVDVQPWFLQDWREAFSILSPGGWVGHWVGGGFFEDLLNPIGAGIVLSVLYFTSLIRMTGLRPIAFIRYQIEAAKKRAAEEERLRYEEATALEKARIDSERLARQIEQEQRAIEKQLKKKKIPIRDDEAMEDARLLTEEPLALPAPPPKSGKGKASRKTASEPEPIPEPLPAQPVLLTPEPEPIAAAAPPDPVPESEPKASPASEVETTPTVAKADQPEEDSYFGAALKKKKGKRPGRDEEMAPLLALARPVPPGDYYLPGTDILDPVDPEAAEGASPTELVATHDLIVETLSHFGVKVHKGIYTPGPTITRYEVIPDRGVRVAKILEYERDLARATKAERINLLAPIPGKETIGIELANSKKQKVTLRELLERFEWTRTKASIPLALGLDVYGDPIVADLAKMPHLLVAGTTGSGKSVCINAIIASILLRFSPEDLQFVMIDPKVVEMQMYNDLPHLAMPVVNEPKRVIRALSWVVSEMERRYRLFAETGVRNITGFNNRPKPVKPEPITPETPDFPGLNDDSPPLAENPQTGDSPTEGELPNSEEGTPEIEAVNSSEILGSTAPVSKAYQVQTVMVPRDEEIIPEKLPFIVVIIDELADLMQTAPADVEAAIARITQMARAAGIHMIVATQTPRADVITGVIKANIPTRIAFQVASKLDSRVILDANGADKLLGQGDMIYLPPGSAQQVRAQGVLVTDEEIRRLVDFCSEQKNPEFNIDLDKVPDRTSGGSDEEDGLNAGDRDLIEKCCNIMRTEKRASASLFQTRLRIGYPKAAFLMNWLEEHDYVKKGQGAKPREINFAMLGGGDFEE